MRCLYRWSIRRSCPSSHLRISIDGLRTITMSKCYPNHKCYTDRSLLISIFFINSPNSSQNSSPLPLVSLDELLMRTSGMLKKFAKPISTIARLTSNCYCRSYRETKAGINLEGASHRSLGDGWANE